MKTVSETPTIEEIADREVAAGRHGPVPDHEIGYDDWLEETGYDDSFVGDGVSVPGTADLYDAMIRAFEAGPDATPSP